VALQGRFVAAQSDDGSFACWSQVRKAALRPATAEARGRLSQVVELAGPGSPRGKPQCVRRRQPNSIAAVGQAQEHASAPAQPSRHGPCGERFAAIRPGGAPLPPVRSNSPVGVCSRSRDDDGRRRRSHGMSRARSMAAVCTTRGCARHPGKRRARRRRSERSWLNIERPIRETRGNILPRDSGRRPTSRPLVTVRARSVRVRSSRRVAGTAQDRSAVASRSCTSLCFVGAAGPPRVGSSTCGASLLELSRTQSRHWAERPAPHRAQSRCLVIGWGGPPPGLGQVTGAARDAQRLFRPTRLVEGRVPGRRDLGQCPQHSTG
jgi:hypothetical protein